MLKNGVKYTEIRGVNGKNISTLTVDEAKAQGAVGVFTNKYGDRVKVYTMGRYSKEICGGPHANTLGELKQFKIKKEEASSAGVRRIKAIILDK